MAKQVHYAIQNRCLRIYIAQTSYHHGNDLVPQFFVYRNYKNSTVEIIHFYWLHIDKHSSKIPIGHSLNCIYYANKTGQIINRKNFIIQK